MTTNKELRRRADAALAASGADPRLLILVYSGSIAILSFLMLLVNLGLDNMIDSTGGLSGMGLRAVLSTAQTVLQSLQRIVVPFFTAGYLYAAMGIARGTCRGPMDLLMGFRHCFSLLFAGLYLVFVLGFLGIAASYLSVMLLSYTPLAGNLTELLVSIGVSDITVLDEATLETLLDAAMPLAVASTLIGAAVLFAASYKYRLLIYCVFDNLGGALRYSLQECRNLIRGNKLRLFRLDLSFWWYYLAQAALMALAYCDLLLSALGKPLPLSSTASLILFSGLYLVGQFGLDIFVKNKIQVTYACFYDDLKNPRDLPEDSLTE